MGNSGFAGNIFGAFLNWLYSSGEISVPADFHSRCEAVREMLDNDISGVVNTVLSYAIASASNTQYHIECPDDIVEDMLNEWLKEINVDVKGIPTGLQELSKEYFKERWAGSSLCVLRVKKWKTLKVGNNSIDVPSILWFVNGASVYVKRTNMTNYVLGSDKYFLDKSFKILLPSENESIFVQKPFDRWFDQYATPYLIKQGVYKNWLAMKVLQDKSDEVIAKILPYLFLIKKGTERLFIDEGVSYDDADLKKVIDNLKTQLETYKNQRGKTPTNAVPFDTEYQHLIPDISKMVGEELYTQGYRAILSGLGFVSVVQGIGDTRKEEVINPKPFIAGVNDGVIGFKSMLLDVVNLIIERNKETHPKLFSEKNKIYITNTPLRLNLDQILDAVRSAYDRGDLSIETYVTALGFDMQTERERRKKELDRGDEDLFYPHLIQNREDVPDRFAPTKPRKEKDNNTEDKNRKKGTPEADNFRAEIELAEAKYIRIRQREPEEFEENSFRIIWLSKEKGIKAVIGKLKGEKKTTIQSYLFDKEDWTEEEAKTWVKEHNGKVEAALEMIVANKEEFSTQEIDARIEEELEIAPYQRNADLPKSVRKFPEGAQNAFRKTFNEVYNKSGGDESKAFPIAWNALKRWMKKHNYTNKAGQWEKKSIAELKAEAIAEKKNKLLDKLLEQKDETL